MASKQTTAPAEVEISCAAIAAYARILRAVSHRVETHAARDGGLICEDRTVPGRPAIWRIRSDGALIADSPYNFAVGGFVPAPLPAALSA